MHAKSIALAFTFLCVSVTAGLAAKGGGLNVLFITLDDMNRDSVGAYGAKVPETTPHMDALARQGLRFEHGHVTIAICQPTRAVWMTGRYPHNSGALGFTKIKPDVPTLPETLRKQGFLTGILGKTEHVTPSRPDAFAYRRGRYEMSNGRSQELYGRFTAEFLGQVKKEKKPFFLMVNAHDPHRPFDDRKPAAERKLDPDASDPEKPDKGKNAGKGGNRKRRPRGDYPAPSRIYQPEEIVVPGFLPDLPPIREEIARYYSSVRRADDVVGRVLAELDEAGFAENTLVMLKSDHGIPVPFAKTNVWRHSTLTPWLVRWPGVVKPGVHETEHLVAGVDFAPTILDALGLPPMKGMDGRSFLPVLKGQKQKGRDHVYTHINTIASGRSYAMRSLQGKRYGLIWNGWSNGETTFRNESMSGLTWKALAKAAETDPKLAARTKHYLYRTPFEFYDYEKDPDALRNLIDDPAHAETIAAYRKKLGDLMKRTGDHETANFRKAVAGSE